MTTARVTESAITAGQQIFYRDLFEGSKDFIEVRLIKADEKPKQIFLTYKELLHYTPPTDWNVYIGVFQRGKKRGRAEDCTTTNAIYLDFDGMELTEIQYRIDMAGIPEPSLIVHSGHGYHCYWLLTESAGQEVQPIIKAMQERLNADPKAVDVPRILRVPDTMNLKGEPVQAELINRNGRRTPLKTLETILDIKAQAAPETPSASVRELSEIRYNGLNNMAAGVSKGERNFCAGRIVQTLKRLNYTKQEASDIVFRWNTLNRPRKPAAELKREINVFWHDERYKYDGRTFTDAHLQKQNELFLDEESIFFAPDVGGLKYDNDFLVNKFYSFSGLTFAVLSIIELAEEEGIELKQIAELCRRSPKDKTLQESLSVLVARNHAVKTVRKGKSPLFHFRQKPFFNKRGYTSVPRLLHKLYLESCNARELEKLLSEKTGKKVKEVNRLTENRYKLMILLEYHAFADKRETFVSDLTLANAMRLTTPVIKKHLAWLERNQYIKFIYRDGSRIVRLIYA